MRPLVTLLALLSGCASMNAALTPSVEVIHDKFDGATIVRQAPVSAAASLDDGWHTLGFEWTSKHPLDISIDAGTRGVLPITGVDFKVDGQAVAPPSIASTHSNSQDGWTVRRFEMPLEEFLRIARANDVKMRLALGDNYTVSEFGPAHPDAIVNSKFKPFIDKVLEISSRL